MHLEVADRLREMIERGELIPGSKLIEKDLCQSFGVSRTPMREAIRVLAADGLVVLTPNRGASVATITEAQILDSFLVIGAMEGLAGELAAPRITDAQLDDIRAMHSAMLECRAADDLDGYYVYNRQIHDAIFDIADNALLKETRRIIFTRIIKLRFIARIAEDEWQIAIKEHEEMLVALEARNGPQLGAILRRHLESKRIQVARWLQRQSSI
ncbi:DNA-binding transcriptional regulator, GntR family [Rhizobium sp. NFR07]|uniref:GntR family transcriptional regulator n=1 Tax=Rhizobium sp. NFR07 TaxID=1566262 RepID=UPI0008E45E82|nr:GntR family transcriptional regulator [Rhizobium sp. NFR07]SFA73724.1 DNA-binding transcriptional regulator, GntR family [Rhizobium sp. NFR07]